MTNLFLMPGETLINLLFSHAPWAASFLGIGKDPIVLRIVLSAFSWFLACLSAWALYRLTLNSIRVFNAVYLTATYRIAQGLGSVKTMFTCHLRRWFPQTGGNSIKAHSDVQFDNIDLAVLRAAAAQEPARTMSAPELAKQFGMRPAQFQCSLQKLHNSKMIDKTTESARGFDTYRLTNYGAAFISMYRRQQAAA